MAMTNINVRTDSEIKAKAQQIFESMGLDMSTAVNIFLRQTVRQNDLPFVLTAQPWTRTEPPCGVEPSVRGSPLHGHAVTAASARATMFGCLHGKYVMADDFDAPLDDFKDYM